MNKYSLTKNKKTLLGVTLYQIKAEISFGSVVKGELGGYIEKEENLLQDGNAWVSGNARVYGNAQVSDDAWVSGNARVYGNARVFGNARVSDDAWVSGNAWVSAKALFSKGWFIGGDDSKKITRLTSEQTGLDSWKAQYVLGDFKITPITDEQVVDDKMNEAMELLKKNGYQIVKN